jgi:hypothetical protein
LHEFFSPLIQFCAQNQAFLHYYLFTLLKHQFFCSQSLLATENKHFAAAATRHLNQPPCFTDPWATDKATQNPFRTTLPINAQLPVGALAVFKVLQHVICGASAVLPCNKHHGITFFSLHLSQLLSQNRMYI